MDPMADADTLMHEQKQIENVSLLDGGRWINGGFLKFQRMLVIYHARAEQIEKWIPYTTIQSVQRRPTNDNNHEIEVVCKDFKRVTFVIANDEESGAAHDLLQSLALPGKVELLDAFRAPPRNPLMYRWPELCDKIDGWRLYDVEREFARMGVTPSNEFWRQTSANQDFEICPTYAAKLYVPKEVSDDVVCGSAKFRSKGRLPCLTFVYQPNQAALCRCAQPMSGVQAKRSEDDETLIAAIHRASPSDQQTMIVDTRPKVNALANKAAGKGFENSVGYPNCRLEFKGIQNIHTMRDSLQALLKVCHKTDSSFSPTKYMKGLAESAWLKHVRAVLKTSDFIAMALVSGSNVVVHCSDGWDRTAQTCSSAGLMLDPYYRTLRGFMVLVEKEWLSFGHKFSDRHRFLNTEFKESSPIFLQFLDVTWQLMNQYPHEFEFNERFLVDLYDGMQACKHGTFLGNCDRERKESNVRELTKSLWTELLARAPELINPLYAPEKTFIKADLCPQRLSVWKSMYCRWNPDTRPAQTLSHLVLFAAEKEQHDRLRLLSIDCALQLHKARNSSAADAICIVPPLSPINSANSCQKCQTPFEGIDVKRHCHTCGHLFCKMCVEFAPAWIGNTHPPKDFQKELANLDVTCAEHPHDLPALTLLRVCVDCRRAKTDLLLPSPRHKAGVSQQASASEIALDAATPSDSSQ